MNNKIHIVSLDIPYPPNYGGAVDIFYKIKSLHALGVEITLHCFQYGHRLPMVELESYCKEIFYYKRKTGIAGLSLTLPYIISSRKNKSLLNNLLRDEEAILFEGIHTTYYAKNPALKHRLKILRAHNIEYLYYEHLAKSATTLFNKLYFKLESKLLKKQESCIDAFDGIAVIANNELAFFKSKAKQVQWISAFHAFDQVNIKLGFGEYCIYHGNLAVAENESVAIYLCEHVFNHLEIPFIVAGKNPSKKLLDYQNDYIKIVANPSDEKLQELLQNAHIQVMPSFQSVGMKLKLLHALFIGRFCITNDTMLVGTNITNGIIRANLTEEFRTKIIATMQENFDNKGLAERMDTLKDYNNLDNANKILQMIISAKSNSVK